MRDYFNPFHMVKEITTSSAASPARFPVRRLSRPLGRSAPPTRGRWEMLPGCPTPRPPSCTGGGCPSDPHRPSTSTMSHLPRKHTQRMHWSKSSEHTLLLCLCLGMHLLAVLFFRHPGKVRPRRKLFFAISNATPQFASLHAQGSAVTCRVSILPTIYQTKRDCQKSIYTSVHPYLYTTYT